MVVVVEVAVVKPNFINYPMNIKMHNDFVRSDQFNIYVDPTNCFVVVIIVWFWVDTIWPVCDVELESNQKWCKLQSSGAISGCKFGSLEILEENKRHAITKSVSPFESVHLYPRMECDRKKIHSGLAILRKVVDSRIFAIIFNANELRSKVIIMINWVSLFHFSDDNYEQQKNQR